MFPICAVIAVTDVISGKGQREEPLSINVLKLGLTLRHQLGGGLITVHYKTKVGLLSQG